MDDIQRPQQLSRALSAVVLHPRCGPAVPLMSASMLRLLPVAVLLLRLAASPTAAFADCTLAKLAELPVTMEGLRPVVPVKINGTDSRLIVDSGAFYSMLSPGSAAELKLKLE